MITIAPSSVVRNTSSAAMPSTPMPYLMLSGLIQLTLSANCMPGSLVLKANSIQTESAKASSVTTSEMTL